MTTKVQIRAAAKALCFQACTDCRSADECDPDDNWIEEARAAFEANKIKSKAKSGNLHNRTLLSLLKMAKCLNSLWSVRTGTVIIGVQPTQRQPLLNCELNSRRTIVL